MNWNVTFQIVTEKSAETGDYAEEGYCLNYGTLREAVDCASSGKGQLGSLQVIEANECPVSNPRRISWIYGSNENGESETRSIHIPKGVTAASRVRLCRVLGVYGCK